MGRVCFGIVLSFVCEWFSLAHVTYSAKEQASTRLPKGLMSAGGIVVWRPLHVAKSTDNV